MPTRELMRRLVEIERWTKIPKKNKKGKATYIYYKVGRTYKRGFFISYQEDEVIKDMCSGKYKGNILMRVPGGPYFKKYKGKDKIYVDPLDMYVKDMKKMVKGYKRKVEKKDGGNILLRF